jgi:hypothetical protein
MSGAFMFDGWIDADATLVAVVIIGIALSAIAYVVGRVRQGAGEE